MPTGIPYCDEVWNVLAGCKKIGTGCSHCWAERMTIRQNAMAAARGDDDMWATYSNVLTFEYGSCEEGKAVGWNGKVETLSQRLDQPLHWRKPRTIFVNSMSDTFHDDVPFKFLDKMFAVMDNASQHTYLLFTKRPERALAYYKDMRAKVFWERLHLYVSASTQAEVDEAVPILLKIPVAVRGLSLEPLLGPVSIFQWVYAEVCGCTDWDVTREGNKRFRCVHCRDSLAICGLDSIIVGCESGPNRRICDLKDIKSIADQCKAAGVPCYVKQIPIDGKCVTLNKKTESIWPAWAEREMPK